MRHLTRQKFARYLRVTRPVRAIVTSHKRRELALEAIVGRFADMEGVIRASWRLNPQSS
jgi:hypothetical protein